MNCDQHMNNKKRAEQVVDNTIDLSVGQASNLVADIERALDECSNLSFLEGLKQGKLSGQKEMRERAALTVLDHAKQGNTKFRCEEEGCIAALIRALPIEEEISEENKRMGCNHPGDICEA